MEKLQCFGLLLQIRQKLVCVVLVFAVVVVLSSEPVAHTQKQ